MKLNIKKEPQRIGVFGVGYDIYWGQFDGLLEELIGKHKVFLGKLEDKGADIVDFGMIDNPKKAYEKVREMQAANLDLMFCNMLTYATSGTFGIIVKTLSIPIVMVALQPRKALDYSNASTYMQLVNDDICAVPEFAGVAARMGN